MSLSLSLRGESRDAADVCDVDTNAVFEPSELMIEEQLLLPFSIASSLCRKLVGDAFVASGSKIGKVVLQRQFVPVYCSMMQFNVACDTTAPTGGPLSLFSLGASLSLFVASQPRVRPRRASTTATPSRTCCRWPRATSRTTWCGACWTTLRFAPARCGVCR